MAISALTPIVAARCFADEPLFPGRLLPVAARPASIVPEDVNGDGLVDLAVSTADGVSVLLGMSNNRFSQAVLYPSPGTDAIAQGHFDGDGFVDLATTQPELNQISVLLGNGDGTFKPAKSFPVNECPRGIVAEDFDGDGYFDVATVIQNSDVVAVLLSSGDGTFASATYFASGIASRAVVAGDFDDNGTFDLAVPGEALALLNGNGDGTFEAPVLTATEDYAESVIAKDFDGDGNLDLAMGHLGSKSNSTVSVHFGAGDSTFSPPQQFSVGYSPRYVTTGDFNGDGIPDIATAILNFTLNYGDPDGIVVRLGTGTGDFHPPVTYRATNGPCFITAADFDGDGQSDLAVAITYDSDNVLVLKSMPEGILDTQLTSGFFNSPLDSTTADFDGDGTIDIATVGVEYDSSFGWLQVQLGAGDGTFSFSSKYAVGLVPTFVTTSDFNGDGITDLATANFYSYSVSILLGAGDGTFFKPVEYDAGGATESLQTVDIDNDGILDLVSSNFNSISIIYGSGEGTFGVPFPVELGGGPTEVSAGHFNGDANSDLAIARPDRNEVLLFLGNGDGTFWVDAAYEVGNRPTAITNSDLNGDGVADLATSNSVDGSVSILIGEGDGSFLDAVDFPASDGEGISDRTIIAAADIDNDGLVDLVTTGPVNSLSVICGHGDGTFGLPNLFAGDYGARFSAIADLNNDGAADLVSTNSRGNNVSVLLNRGSSEQILLGDVNLDGEVNLLDVAPFVDLIVAANFQAEADVNQDGEVNLLDVAPFVDLLAP